jgi:outer membrane protein TolC
MALPLSTKLPRNQLNFATVNTDAQALTAHPAVLNIAQQAKAMAVGVDVAKQGYKSQWGVNASYSYRADMPNNSSRADLVSVGVTFDLPLFTANRQDQKVKAAISSTEAVKTDKILLVRQMSASAKAIQAQLQQLTLRQNLYRNQLLPQVHQQAEAALNAYGNDDGDFSEVMRARIAELNTNIAALNIEIEQQILITRLNYFLIGNAG